jgi:hypothetical protein
VTPSLVECETASTEASSFSLSSNDDEDDDDMVLMEELSLVPPPRSTPQLLLKQKSIVSKWNKFAAMEEMDSPPHQDAGPKSAFRPISWIKFATRMLLWHSNPSSHDNYH